MDKLVFVIHKHQATSLHYDFRLQVGKVMPSWAIPKGPTLDPKFKRLSVKVNDHAFDYRNLIIEILKEIYLKVLLGQDRS
jgi:bifunctional non-homologous end joining protein LigD